MRAVRYHKYGGPEVLVLETAPQPTPQPGEVLIEVAGTTFNPADAGIRSGGLAEVFPITFPHTPGIDVSGRIAGFADDAGRFAIGDPVVAFLPMNANGAAAEFVTAPADVVAPAPRSVPLPDAAALVVGGLTAWQSLHDLAGVEAGQRIFINGASGAVGGFAIQLARRAGAHVTATAKAPARDRVRAQGADEIVGYVDDGTTDIPGAPFDTVLNFAPVPPAGMERLAGLLVDGGVLVSTTTPPAESLPRGIRGAREFLTGDSAQLAELSRLVDAGELTIDIASRRPLAELAAVHADADAGRLSGKTVLQV